MIDLQFKVCPDFLRDRTRVENPVKVTITAPSHPRVKELLGESGLRMAGAGAPFYFTRRLAEELISANAAVPATPTKAPGKQPDPKAVAEAAILTSQGYRRVSRAHGIVARVDRPDWREAMASTHPDGMEWVGCLGAGAPDHYRRCHSKDSRKVEEATALLVPGSNWDETGYIPQREDRSQ